jgi:hypothetical protein
MLFIALVFSLAFLIIIGVYASGKLLGLPDEIKRRNLTVTLFTITGWLSFTLIVAASGWLTDFGTNPPRIFLLMLPAIAGVLFALFSSKIFNYVNVLNNFWLIYVQGFRILMEVILWMLYRYKVIPVQMTFEGLNFDILIGLTAPIVAYYCFSKNKWSYKVAIAWNIAGLILLLNIVVVAVLSAPLPFRVFTNEPANTIVFGFPFVWLPVFVVPLALVIHLLSLKKLTRMTATT